MRQPPLKCSRSQQLRLMKYQAHISVQLQQSARATAAFGSGWAPEAAKDRKPSTPGDLAGDMGRSSMAAAAARGGSCPAWGPATTWPSPHASPPSCEACKAVSQAVKEVRGA